MAVLALNMVRANPGDRYLADAFPDAIARRLSTLTRISLFSPYAVRRIAPTNAPNAARVAREMGTRYLVTGLLTAQAGRPQLEVVLFDSMAPAALWRQQFAADANSIAAAESLSTVEIAKRIAPNSSPAEMTAMMSRGTKSTDAFELFLHGEDGAKGRGTGAAQRAVNYFRQAIAVDSRYAEAHAFLAEALMTTLDDGSRESLVNVDSVTTEALRHAEVAVQLAPKSARAWESKGMVLAYTRARWGDARKAFEEARHLDPRDPQVAWLRGRAFLRMGQRREAEESLRLALQLSPAFAPALLDLGDIALGDGKLELACGWLNAAVQADPYVPQSYALRALARKKERDMRLSWSDAEIATRLGARTVGEAASALTDARSGDTTRARSKALKLFRELDRRTRIGAAEARLAALALVSVRENDRAVSILERAFPRDGYLGNALEASAFAPLKSNDRFRKIVSDIVAATNSHAGVRAGGT